MYTHTHAHKHAHTKTGTRKEDKLVQVPNTGHSSVALRVKYLDALSCRRLAPKKMNLELEQDMRPCREMNRVRKQRKAATGGHAIQILQRRLYFVITE